MRSNNKKLEGINILVIKHGALGDFILSTGPFKAIRQHHRKAKITLLTTSSFLELGNECGWFDNVLLDTKPKLWNLRGVTELRKTLIKQNFFRVYDLQTSMRSSIYYRLLQNPKPEWSGIASGCSHPHTNPFRDNMHTLERQAEQLKLAGILEVSETDISWLNSSLKKFCLPSKYALLVSGGAAHRSKKRWPASSFSEFAKLLVSHGIVPVLIGSSSEEKTIDFIQKRCPEAVNLCGNTKISDIAALARDAVGALGNDTGPMHIIAAAKCPSLVLFSKESNPSITAPCFDSVKILQKNDLRQLTVSDVQKEFINL